jgi:predicted DNA-binding transcriptional regulator AlpA
MSRTPSSNSSPLEQFSASDTSALPTAGFARQWQLIGEAPVTPEQAAANKHRGKGPRRPRPGSSPVIPWSSATLWRMVKAGKFPAPKKLSPGVTGWWWGDIHEWIRAAAAPSRGAKS